MAGRIDAILAEKKIELPKASTPAAAYVPFVKTGNLVVVAGQVTVWNGEWKFIGKVGADFTIEQGQEAARLCGLNMIAHLRNACDGDLDRVTRVVRLGGFVNAGPDFHDHPKVINGASELMMDIWGDAGKHARAAVGCSSLPFNVAVEIDGIFEVA